LGGHQEKTRRETVNNSSGVLIGNVTADPELTFTTSGQARLSFSLACNYVWYDQSNEKQEKVSYFNVVAWRYIAEAGARVLEKGVGAVVTGRFEQRSYEDKEGNKRSTVEFIADNIAVNSLSLESIERRKRQENDGATGGASRGGQSSAPRRRPAMANAGIPEDEPF
jgi:single-strand DNA-binding protein